MKYKAVIFDLYGTLIDKFPMDAYRQELRDMAAAISAPPDDFRRWWFDTYDDRGSGKFQSYEENIGYICDKLGIRADDDQIKQAVEILREFGPRYFKPRPDAIELLTYLKSNGYKTGLISDCSVAVPRLFKGSALAPLIDVTTFSCLVGTQKPDPRIYQLTTERMSVEPADCLYIGDGDSNELTGALQAGMHPILIRDPEEDRNNVYRTNFEGDNWPGPVISSLIEVLNLIE